MGHTPASFSMFSFKHYTKARHLHLISFSTLYSSKTKQTKKKQTQTKPNLSHNSGKRTTWLHRLGILGGIYAHICSKQHSLAPALSLPLPGRTITVQGTLRSLQELLCPHAHALHIWKLKLPFLYFLFFFPKVII